MEVQIQPLQKMIFQKAKLHQTQKRKKFHLGVKPNYWILAKKKRKRPILVEFNERGQPIGQNAALFSSFIGASARELIPMTAATWKDLSATFKDQIWIHITTSFIVDEFYKKHIFRKMMKLWRDHRSLVVKQVEEQAKVVGLQRAAALLKPNNIESMDEWLAFIKNRTSAGFKEKCEKFKRMRARRTLPHRTSRKSFARLEEELREQSENPDAISRSDIWIHAYEAKKKKGSEEVVEDPEIVKQVKQKRAEQEPSQTPSLKDDAVAQVLGPDPRGRVRGLGFGAVPSKLEYQTKVGSKVANLEKQVSNQAQNMLSQSQEIERLKEVVATLLARSEKERNNHQVSNSVQHSATKFSLRTQNENPSVQHHSSDGIQSKHNIASVRGSESGRPQSKQSNQKKTGSIQHSAGDGSQSKDKEGKRTKVTKDDQNRIELLSWFEMEEQVVAIAKLESKDPNVKVHHVPLGHECWKVWVLDVFEDIALYRPTREFGTLSMAQGSTVAWPIKYIKQV
ncbi:uncharacterized protein LOC112198394 isoform X1 [Rosa chinensis]|uniref:uncharacterized protein LOC112198394 isoform X1 n=1 Tax=Rosa chinensis TaxID=74649 RepID=UPI001AD8CD4B|nr:uncharacterized protein LOC112198394 isoform X1 [Rosa chinensis]XP_040369374.1 uncharacterized protein LOC112198394 isoform X1 [Rosa chinensis]XP_040369376.1 uncharacterized protein LOC112198394 isoform X1 [Rosa chinensis]XP_040369378.1 uncharacterized protein LOC112198394 isoform X1 [Rosa chinensis]XP_040369379.1 uncharacterized protein LOC112198394 isoform X1 [Rosa chinensis]